jgi:hypothetical protein
MTDARSLQQLVDDAAQATRKIWNHLERLTAEAFAAAEQQRLIEKAKANARKRELGPMHGRPRVAAT